MSSFNKSDLLNHIVADTSLRRTEAEAALKSLLSGVQAALAGGDKVTLVGFGTFQTRDRSARTGRNPQTGEPIQIPASKSVNFKAGRALRDAVNS